MIRRIVPLVLLLWCAVASAVWADSTSNNNITALQRQMVEALTRKDFETVQVVMSRLETLADHGQTTKAWSRTAIYGLLAEIMYSIEDLPVETARYYKKAVNAAQQEGKWLEGDGLRVRNELGSVLLELQRLDEAHDIGTALLADLEQLGAVQSDVGMDALFLVAATEFSMERFGEAERAAQRLLYVATLKDPGGRMAGMAGSLLAMIAVGEEEYQRRTQQNTARADEASRGAGAFSRSPNTTAQDSSEVLDEYEVEANRLFATNQLDEYQDTLLSAITFAVSQTDVPPVRTANLMVRLSEFVLEHRGDLDAAHYLLTNAIEILDRSVGPDHVEMLRARAEWIFAKNVEIASESIWRPLGRQPVFWDGSEADKTPSVAELRVFRKLAEYEQLNGSRSQATKAALNYVDQLTQAGRDEEVVAVFRSQMEHQKSWRAQGGRNDPQIDYLLASGLGDFLIKREEFGAAARVLSDGLQDVLAYLRDPFAFSDMFPAKARRLHQAGQSYGKTYASAAWQAGQLQPMSERRGYKEMVFEAMQLAGVGPATHAVARAAARTKSQEPELVALLDRWQGTTEGRVHGGGEDAHLHREMTQQFSDFFEWHVPTPLTLNEVQQNLASPEEAIILILPAGVQAEISGAPTGLVIGMTRESVAWSELPLDWHRLTSDILDLHNALDPRDGALRAPLAHVQKGASENLARQNLPFAFGAANRLYDAFFGDVEIATLIESKRIWTVIPMGEAMSVPFAALVVEDAKPDGGAVRNGNALRQVRWLGHERAINVVPSVAALSALRSREASEDVVGGGKLTYVGFGDPRFAGAQTGNLPATDLVMRGDITDRAAAIRGLPPLPATRREVETLARLFGSENSRVFLGDQATEASLRELDTHGAFQQADVVHLATHGLLTGAFEDLAEPALALTPQPGSTSALRDGLLTASEAGSLNIDADWVILSACDTAGEVSIAGEGLGGLVQGFFTAGARNLLVSHWRVDDRAAEQLITKTVTASYAGINKSEALRLAMRELADDPSRDGTGMSYAHPSMWAPFFLVGGG